MIRWLAKWIVMIPYGIMMSGPFAVWGTVGGFVVGFIIGKWVF